MVLFLPPVCATVGRNTLPAHWSPEAVFLSSVRIDGCFFSVNFNYALKPIRKPITHGCFCWRYHIAPSLICFKLRQCAAGFRNSVKCFYSLVADAIGTHSVIKIYIELLPHIIIGDIRSREILAMSTNLHQNVYQNLKKPHNLNSCRAFMVEVRRIELLSENPRT